MIVRAAVLAAVALAVPAFAGCAGPASYPDPGLCPSPATSATPSGSPGRTPGAAALVGAYSNTIKLGLQRISDLREGQRSANPDDTFSRKPEFRTAFATYADNTICVAQALQGMKAPDQRYAEFDSNLDAALQALIDHTAAGRLAVGKRNTTDYRTWFKGVDAKIEALHVLYDGRPR